jgi:drug/metabolite transporter (DMT)-like permease
MATSYLFYPTPPARLLHSRALTPSRPDTLTASRQTRAAYAALAVGVLGIGWSAIFVKLSGVPGSTSAFYRLAIAQLVFVPWRLVARSPSHPPSRAGVMAAVWAGVAFAADLALFNTAIMRTSAGNATLLGVNAPIFVAFGAWLVFGERPTVAFWSGFALSFVGMIAIVGSDVIRHPVLGIGDAMALGGAICYAVYLLYLQRSRSEMDALTFSAVSGVVASVTLLLICLVIRAPLSGFPPRSWAALVGLALVTQVIGHLAVAYSLGKVPAPVASVVLLAQAPITVILAVPILGERITVEQLVGGALVLAGIAVVNFRAQRDARTARLNRGQTPTSVEIGV